MRILFGDNNVDHIKDNDDDHHPILINCCLCY